MPSPRSPLVVAFVCVTLLAASCAESGEGTTGTGSGGIDWSGAGAGTTTGSGANGGATSSTGGDGGMGGTGGSSSSGGGNGGSTSSTGGGGMGTGTLLAIAVGASSGITASSLGGQAWSSSPLGEGSPERPAIAFTSDGNAEAFFLGGSAVRSVAYGGGSFGAPSTYATNAQGAPAYATAGMTGHVAYHGSDFLHYYGQAEPVQPPAGAQSFGPSAPAIGGFANEAVLAFAGNDGMLYTQARANGQWAGAVGIANGQVQLPPTMVALSGGNADALLVWVNDEPNMFDDKKVFFATRSGGTWSAGAKIDDTVFTDDALSLAPLAGGDALLVFRGTDMQGYGLVFSGGSWTSPAPLMAGTLASPPGVATGVDGHDAEVCYVSSSGAAWHTSLAGGQWSMPDSIGGSGLLHCAIAARP